MKIKIYLMGWRDRWGNSGVMHHYTERDHVSSLMPWLSGEDAHEILIMLDQQKPKARIFSRIGEMLDSSGHEFIPEIAIVDVDEAEKLPEEVAP